MSTEYEVQNVAFDEGALVIGYIALPDDVRVDGAVVLQHQITLATGHPDYGEDALRLHDRVVRLLKNALEDFATSEPYVMGREEDEDDERGMGE